jgi:hypothetical protein
MDWLIKKKIMDAEDEGWGWMRKHDALKRKADALCEAAVRKLNNPSNEIISEKFKKAIAEYEKEEKT